MRTFIAIYLFVGSMFGAGAATSGRAEAWTVANKATAYAAMTLMWPGVVVAISREMYDRNYPAKQ